MRVIKLAVLPVIALFILSGCTTVGNMIKYRHLDVRTHTDPGSQSFDFPNMPPPGESRLYIKVADQTGHRQNLGPFIADNYREKKYEIVQDPRRANIIMSAHITYLDKIPADMLQKTRRSGTDGFPAQGTIGGGALGATLGWLFGDGMGAAIGGVAGAITGGLGEELFKSAVQFEGYALIANVTVEVANDGRSGSTIRKARYGFTAYKNNLSQEEAFSALTARLVNVFSELL